MPELTVLSEVASPGSAAPPGLTSRRRLAALGVVLSVSVAHFIATAFYSLLQQEKATRYHSQFPVFIALLAEVVSLLLLWFVLWEQGRSWAGIGWTPQPIDLLHGIFLIAGSFIVSRMVTLIFQGFAHRYTGHFVQPRSIHGVIGAGFSWLTLLFVFVNPFFEELIVRGYTMSEVIDLSGSRNLGIILSVVIQMSYHVYQGLVRCIAVTAVFLVFSVYFSRTRKIVPVIVAHCWSDVSALLRVAS